MDGLGIIIDPKFFSNPGLVLPKPFEGKKFFTPGAEGGIIRQGRFDNLSSERLIMWRVMNHVLDYGFG